jgi:hypothetical protein
MERHQRQQAGGYHPRISATSGVAAELVLDDPSVMQVLDIVDGVDEVVHDDE